MVLITLMPLTIVHLGGLKHRYNLTIQDELLLSQKHAKTVGLTFMNYIEENWVKQNAIGTYIVINDHWTNEDIDRYLADIHYVKQLKGYSWISPDGITLASSNEAAIGVSVEQMEFFERVISGEKNVVSNLRESILDDSLVFHIATAVYSDNELKGILLGIVDISSLNSIFGIEVTETTMFGIVDNSGRLVYNSGETNNMSFNERLIDSNSLLREAIEGKAGSSSKFYSKFDNGNRLGSVQPIEDIGWGSFYSVPAGEIISDLIKFLKFEVVIFLLTLYISVLIAIVIANKYSSSIELLKDAVEEISKGNLTVKTNFRDELASTSEAFNKMTKEINNQITQRDEITTVKTKFFSTVSHELKTPINIILGAVQLMEKTEDLDRYSRNKYLKMQKQNSYRLLRLINNLIDINKIESNQFKINPVNCNIVELVEDITLSVSDYVELKNIEIIFDTNEEEIIIAVDPDKIERILLNLISNAIKFTNPGGRVEVTVLAKEDKVDISVKDSGIGIPENMLEAIFSYFTQVGISSHRKAEGSGIGLSLVKSLVDLHGGSVKVFSIEGKGSEFIVELPLITIENTESQTEEKSFPNIERINIEFSDIYLKLVNAPNY